MWDHVLSDTTDEVPADLAELRNTVACELNAQLGLRGEVIHLADACEVAYAVAVRLRRGYRVERVVPPHQDLPDDDSLSPDCAVFYGSVQPERWIVR